MSRCTICGNGKVEGGEIGDIKAVYSSNISYGWLACNGDDTTGTDYELQIVSPILYAKLGNSNILPDFRECVLVGIGESGRSIIESTNSHDIYTLGEFKNDQMQEHKHPHDLGCDKSDGTNWAYRCGVSDYWMNNNKTGYNDGRTGNTTHGKQVGVNYCIKYL